MGAAPIRLGTLARVLDRTGRLALRDGVELRSLTLTVPVAERPVRDPARLWRIAVVSSGPGRWARLLAWLGWPPPGHPLVRLVWENGAVFAELAPQQPPIEP